MQPGAQPPKTPKTPKSPKQASLRQRRAIALAVVGSALLVATIVLAILTISTRGQSTAADMYQTDISQVLSLADQHKLRSAVIASNLITVTTTDGQHYSATKEDGQ